MKELMDTQEAAMTGDVPQPAQRETTLTEEDKRDERELLLQHRAGDPEAFSRLVAQYRAPVYSYLIRCDIPESDRDDLFQDIFIKIHKSANQYDKERPAHPWIFTVVANTVRTYHRKRKIRRLLFSDASTPNEPKAYTPNGESLAQAKQTAAWLQTQIRSLPAVQREVLVLACIENLAQKDIAQALEMPVNTVKTHLRRARLALVQKMSRRNVVTIGETS
jgi:RNA polymerase sigma-70 factor (ECF subfamily)